MTRIFAAAVFAALCAPPALARLRAKAIEYKDQMILPGLPGFEAEMRKVGADWQVTEHGGAGRSFAVAEAGSDPSAGMAYDREADERSWKALADHVEL